MKLYSFQAPNPFRVEVFLREKGITLPTVSVDVLGGETRKSDFLRVNSLGEVPVLELDDGTRLTESLAICRYLEGLHPEPALMGSTALELAKVEMWSRRMEQQIMDPPAQIGLHLIPFFAEKIEQMPAYAETQRRLLAQKWIWLDRELSDGRTYVCDDRFSVADITGMAALMICDFMDESVPDGLAHAKRWESAVRGRPSWSA
ncbi:MAG: glutathione S-transferase family protein [Rhodospirillales bacterium]